MKLVSFNFYWKYNNGNIIEIVNLIRDKDFLFTPEELHYEGEFSFEEGIKDFVNIDFDIEEDINASIYGNIAGEKARLYFSVQEWGKQRIIKILLSCSIASNSDLQFIDSYLKITDLICCFVFDTNDEFWQSEYSINHYQIYDMPYKHLPLSKDRAGSIIIDTSSNYGRSEHAISIQFLAASEMYFGEIFFKIIPKNILLNNSEVKEVNKGKNNLLRIMLFNMFDNSIEEIRQKQKSFLENTKMFVIVNNLHENYRSESIALSSLGL